MNERAGTIYIHDGEKLDNPGPMTQRVIAYDKRMREILPNAKTPDDWAPIAEFIDTETFQRVGCFLERQDWQDYTQMLSQWSSATKEFNTKLLHVTECGNMVFYEVQETHHRDNGSGAVDVVNSMTAFTFSEAGKIVALRVYLQTSAPLNL